MTVWLLVVLACGVPENPGATNSDAPPVDAVTLVEAFDVPPPPGARTVEFELSWQPKLGELVSLRHGAEALSVDVVDVRPSGQRFTVTGYAAEADVEQALRQTGWTASP